ncbi:MAG: hypothetical protein DSY37_01065 [Hyperthermus sp.]|nr:MAG: hypothetical protein DSY37_01065 [Hyperthermus sp.]
MGETRVLWRREFLELERRSSWLLVYGRRKTGKSFMVRLLLPWRLYVTVTRDLTTVVEEPGKRPVVVEIEEAMSKAVELLSRNAVVVIDEFQRLPERYWDMLATRHPEGRLVLVASSLGAANRVFDRRSPLLGLVMPLRIDPLRYADVVSSLLPRLGPRRALLWGVVLREPWLLPLVPGLESEPWRFVASNAYMLAQMVRGLVGEVFEEEERRLTRLYEAALRLLAAGVWSSARLAGLLYQRGLLSSAGAGPATGLLDRLSEIGLVAKTRLWRTRGARVYYRHSSPLLAIVYGLAERYGIDEQPGYDPGLLLDAARSLYARELQFTLGELLAEHHGGLQAYTLLPGGQGDIDVVVLDHKGRRAIAAYEVKLGPCSQSDMKTALQRAEVIGAKKAGIACLGGIESQPPPGLEALGPQELAEAAIDCVKKAVTSTQQEA